MYRTANCMTGHFYLTAVPDMQLTFNFVIFVEDLQHINKGRKSKPIQTFNVKSKVSMNK